MIKFRLYLDKDTEAEWLNQMAADGFAMTGFCAGFYRFERCEPGKYIYQVDFGNRLFGVSEEYREFMQDMGVEIVQIWGFWVILRRLASEGPFELYTDVDSRIEHYRKIRRLFKVVTVIELLCFFMQVFCVIEGSGYAFAFMFLIGAILIGLVNATFKMNRIIEELQERKGECPPKKCRGRVSILLPCGMLINCCALLLREAIAPAVTKSLQIVAIILMLVGIFRTARCENK